MAHLLRPFRDRYRETIFFHFLEALARQIDTGSWLSRRRAHETLELGLVGFAFLNVLANALATEVHIG